MRSYGAAALLLLAIVTECLSAERSRQRSGPIRSVPIAANVKRDVDFDCPEEFGYYPHPTDCTLYYVCVFGGALLESCTGGLMYSHELQTCDWPRNVGCDGASAAGGEEIERLTERDRRPPPPPPPRRTQTPPPLQAQPKPVITSRGQPKFNRAEYEKQQQLYAEVDDLPPVEEIESDRQQRVYRGQPSTIGQVQKDRDGYATLLGGSTRNFNSNIIPASISHNSKLGSFSVGTQVEDRRTATTIAPPHSYNGNEILTDSHHDRHIDIDSNDIDDTKDKTLSRRKRDVVEISKSENKTDKPDEISNKNDESMEYYDVDFDDSYLRSLDDNERGKRQVRFYVKNNNPGYKTSGKNWVSSKPIKFLEYIQSNRHPINQNTQHVRYPQLYNNNNNYYDNNRRPSHESESYSPTKSLYLRENSNQRPFKASLPDLSNNHNPLNIATQIITKSPPISALIHNENQYSSGNYHSGATNGYQTSNKYSPVTFQPSPQVSYKDSSLLPSTVVTGKPVPSSTYPAVKTQNKRPTESEEEYEESSYEDYSSEEDKNDDHAFRPPYEFTHPHKDKFLNPFANPNFDFDAFLEKLSDGDYRTQKANQPTSPRTNTSKTTYVDYKGMSSPTPFGGQEVTIRPGSVSEKYIHDRPLPNTNSFHQNQQIIENQNIQQQLSYAQSIGPALDAVKLKIKPPNFNDDRQLPISYSFGRLIDIPSKNEKHKEEQKSYPVTQKPYNILLTATASPIVFSSPKHQYYINSDKVISLRPYVTATSKPYSGSSETPKEYLVYKHTTPNPVTTLTNKQLHILQQFWKNASTEKAYPQHVTARPSTTPDLARLKNLFAQAIASSPRPQTKNQSPINYNQVSTTIKPTTKRRPIPKPSPEMNDYYYDEEEYYEPLVKPKYMPSTEIKPQRPFMAQNYKQYDDNFDTLIEQIQPQRQTKNANEFATNSKEHNQNNKGKIPVPVYVDFISSTPTSIKRPNVSNIEIINRARNKTTPFRKPNYENGPNTVRPPKFLNQTTLRPYTVRHRLAKPTIAIDTDYSLGQQKEKPRHKNIVAQMLTTPRDSHNQETRYTKSKHDGRTNSLEPTESMPYSPSPKPKMLYNGSQTYSSDQYDPYYAVYEDEAELYKDTEYVHYNMGSARPAVQTIQGNAPPPVRNPIDFTAYSLRPTSANEDYDNILLQGQMRDQNQYRTPNRQANRGDGNELGYDHHPISVKTTIYEATPISTTYRTTSTSTTQRPTTTTSSTTTTTARTTTAPVTEAMTPTRYNSRSSTDENPIPNSDSLSNTSSSDDSVSSIPTTPSSAINFSSLAKPFEKTDNLRTLEEIVPTSDTVSGSRNSYLTNNNDQSVEVVRSNNDEKKIVSLTTGFSIRRNLNNSNNPYTLTVLTRPLADYDKPESLNATNSRTSSKNYYYDSSSESNEKFVPKPVPTVKSKFDSSKNSLRRKDSRFEFSDDYDLPIRGPSNNERSKPNFKPTTPPPTRTTKYYLKSIIKRPTPFSKYYNEEDNTENNLNLASLIDAGLQNAKVSNIPVTTQSPNEVNITPKRKYNIRYQNNWDEPVPSLKPVDSGRSFKEQETFIIEPSTTPMTPPTKDTTPDEEGEERAIKSKPKYYTYRLEDEFVPNETTEALSSTVKNVIKAFFNNFGSSPAPPRLVQYSSSTTSKSIPKTTQKIVNIGFQKKPVKYSDEKPLRKNVNRVQIITEPSSERIRIPLESVSDRGSVKSKDFSSTTQTMTTMSTTPIIATNPPTTPKSVESSFGRQYVPSYQSKFRGFVPIVSEPTIDTTTPSTEVSRKFQNIINVLSDSDNAPRTDDELISEDKTLDTTRPSEIDWNSPSSDLESDIASTTSTTKSTTTTTLKIDPTKSTSKIASFPTRASRVNPAIKLAASNPGSGRRSYQSSSKCSTDNSLQANPKCNEIKYQRPTSTRGRGSAHYSTLSGNEAPQTTPNRGTPPTRSRPTLKPSTAIVSKSTEFSDIYAYPPSRPAPVYPQPIPDKTAAKCRKDVCLLPDCYCGGKEIPGDLPVEQVPQIVLLTFDDSVNDLNKVLYTDLFEKGRVNPNGCPISATFYVSHEWTDYSQVQNLYSAGHEMASHTISHSFGEQFSQKKWNREVGGQREILAAYGGVKLEDVRGMRAPFLSIGGNKMFKMLYDSNFTYDSSMPVYENRPPSWPYTLDYKLFHDCMIPPCPTKSYPGVWEVPMVMWQDLNGGRCSMGDACANPPEADGVYKMLLKNFDRHYTTNRAPFGLYYHAAWFTQPHHKEGFIKFLDFINRMDDVWIVTNWQALQWVRDPTPINRLNSFQPFQCNYQDRPKKCNNPKVCNLWHKSGVRYMRTCQPCPEVYPWTGKTGIRSSRIDNDNGE